MSIVNLHYSELLEQFLQSPINSERYDFNFPLAVYGTLRSIPKDQGNMKWFNGVTPDKIQKGFLKHCEPDRIYLNPKKDNFGPFEVYYFNDESFEKMIPGIDRLESFSPRTMFGYYYKRTLAYVSLLPDGFQEDVFCKGIGSGLHLEVDTSVEFEKIPCWIYSNKAVNKILGNQLIWCFDE